MSTDSGRLASRLRELREARGLTQRQVAEALGVSVPSVSSWENPRGRTSVPDERLSRYARVLAPADLADRATERETIEAIEKELRRLRERVVGEDSGAKAEVGRLGGQFWHFPDGQRVTLIGTPLPEDRLASLPYAQPEHPNYIRSLRNADIDSTLELFGHVRAENPDSHVRFTTAERVRADELTGHVVVLGAADYAGAMIGNVQAAWFAERMSLPVTVAEDPNGDPEYDRQMRVTVDEDGRPSFGSAREELYSPVFLEQRGSRGSERLLVNGVPQLVYDLAVIARQPNPLNLNASLTLCCGLFTRGTYGAVRAFTDAQLRQANEAYQRERFPDPGDFWMIVRVPVYGATTVTPDLAREYTRVLEWPPAPPPPGNPP